MTVRLWKDGRLKELAPTMFSSQDDFQAALDFWYGEGWEEREHDTTAKDTNHG